MYERRARQQDLSIERLCRATRLNGMSTFRWPHMITPGENAIQKEAEVALTILGLAGFAGELRKTSVGLRTSPLHFITALHTRAAKSTLIEYSISRRTKPQLGILDHGIRGHDHPLKICVEAVGSADFL